MSLYAVTVKTFGGKSVIHYLCAYTARSACNETLMRHGASHVCNVRFCGLI